MYYIYYGISGPSLLIESTDSMISTTFLPLLIVCVHLISSLLMSFFPGYGLRGTCTCTHVHVHIKGVATKHLLRYQQLQLSNNGV